MEFALHLIFPYWMFISALVGKNILAHSLCFLLLSIKSYDIDYRKVSALCSSLSCRCVVSPAKGWRKISPIGWMNDTPFWPSAVISSVGAASPPVKKKKLKKISELGHGQIPWNWGHNPCDSLLIVKSCQSDSLLPISMFSLSRKTTCCTTKVAS